MGPISVSELFRVIESMFTPSWSAAICRHDRLDALTDINGADQEVQSAIGFESDLGLARVAAALHTRGMHT